MRSYFYQICALYIVDNPLLYKLICQIVTCPIWKVRKYDSQSVLLKAMIVRIQLGFDFP